MSRNEFTYAELIEGNIQTREPMSFPKIFTILVVSQSWACSGIHPGKQTSTAGWIHNILTDTLSPTKFLRQEVTCWSTEYNAYQHRDCLYEDEAVFIFTLPHVCNDILSVFTPN